MYTEWKKLKSALLPWSQGSAKSYGARQALLNFFIAQHFGHFWRHIFIPWWRRWHQSCLEEIQTQHNCKAYYFRTPLASDKDKNTRLEQKLLHCLPMMKKHKLTEFGKYNRQSSSGTAQWHSTIDIYSCDLTYLLRSFVGCLALQFQNFSREM